MDSHNDLEKSRTRLKKEAAALQKMGQRLVGLSEEQLERMDLPAQLIDAIRDVRPMKSHGARRRQMQYIGTLMRKVDAEPIEQALLEIEQGDYRQAKTFHQIEAWRDRLVGGDDDLIDEISDALPEASRQRLGQLVRSARKEKEKNAPPKSARNLFRYLKALSTDG